ncbi:hypothetical protein D3C72_1203290 [compost metagenome]
MDGPHAFSSGDFPGCYELATYGFDLLPAVAGKASALVYRCEVGSEIEDRPDALKMIALHIP